MVEITGQSEAVKNAQAMELKRQEEMTDAFGNTVKVCFCFFLLFTALKFAEPYFGCTSMARGRRVAVLL